MQYVKVHYDSAQTAQLNAHAYAQGTNIHVASGQEKHLPHEAWHVVQQKQGRVNPTTQARQKNTPFSNSIPIQRMATSGIKDFKQAGGTCGLYSLGMAISGVDGGVVDRESVVEVKSVVVGVSYGGGVDVY